MALIAVPVTLALLSPSPSPCPPSFYSNAALEEQILKLLSTTAEGKGLQQNIQSQKHNKKPKICFGSIPVPALTDNFYILLNAKHSLPESASRLGHLYMHVLEGLPMHSAARDCDSRVDYALTKEARAFAVELRLRKALGLLSQENTPPALPFEFESAFWKSPELEREALIKNYLVEHPHGGPGVDALAASYLKRCKNTVP